jgi:uronate dehydrogenase
VAQFKRILLTGAAGALGKVLREGLAPLCETLRLSDKIDMGEAASNEEIVVADLDDFDAVLAMTKDVDAIVHFGSKAVEGRYQEILHSNIMGGYNIYEAARKNGVPRIVFASSNHLIGYYPRTQRIDDSVPHRPDTMYGVSKAFVEDLASMYFDKHGIETVSLRIGSCFPEPRDVRMLATWMSYRDLIQLVTCSLTAHQVGFRAVYGVSDNREQFWDNSSAALIGYRPQDDAEVYREKVMAKGNVLDRTDPAVVYCGGGYVNFPHWDDKEDE